MLNMLRPVAYNMKSDPARIRRIPSGNVGEKTLHCLCMLRRFGFIADEMQQVLPEVVRYTGAMNSASWFRGISIVHTL